jgi:Rieske Fe-S protein
MGIGLVAGYGGAGWMAARYLYPARPALRRWLFVCTLRRLEQGDSLVYVTPTGERVAVARQSARADADAFVALSSTCPHLGCQVHWQPQRTRFFCPCHNGVFDPTGKALEGPPADAGTDLPRYPLRVEGGLLYIEVPVERLA